MKAAVLAIGDELTCGYVLDTNSQLVSRRLAAIPADVVLHASVGDDMEAIQRALAVALDAADVIVVAGGLGPTEDDLTRQAVAAYFRLPLVEDAGALSHIQERFAHRGLPMPESNRTQAQAPAGSVLIPNSRGTAAGFYLQTPEGKHVFVLPGVPYEMEGMLEGFVLPRLRELAGAGRHVQRAYLKVYGLPESEVNERIRPLLARGRNPLLGLLPHRGVITIEATAAGATPEEAQALLEKDLAELRAKLGRHLFSEDGRDLPQAVADLLVERGLTIAVAEVGTGGLAAARLTQPEGCERWFRGSVVRDERAVGGSSGREAALALALAARQESGADIGVGVGGLVVPPDSAPDRPYGLLYAAVDLRGRRTCRQFRFNGERAVVRAWAADAVLDLVRLWVLKRGNQGE